MQSGCVAKNDSVSYFIQHLRSALKLYHIPVRTSIGKANFQKTQKKKEIPMNLLLHMNSNSHNFKHNHAFPFVRKIYVYHFVFSFAVLIEEMSILRIEPQSCETLFAISFEIMFAFCAISIQYSVS